MIRAKIRAKYAQHWLRMCSYVGQEAHLVGKPTIYADGKLHIGNRFHLSSLPVPSHLASGPDGRLYIGDDVSIGCGAAISAFEHVHIGNGTQIGPFVIIMDTNFHGATGNQAIHHDCRPITIGNGCRIGSRVTITRGAVIGDGAEILAGSVVSSEIPPGVCAAGARATIIGQAGASTSRWDSAAAVLPNVLMKSLGLASVPNIDSSSIPAHLWTNTHIHNLLSEIHDCLGVTMDYDSVRKITTYADVASAVNQLLHTIRGTKTS